MTVIVRLLVLIGFITLAAPVSQAHELRPAYLELTQQEDFTYSVLWKTPVRFGRPLNIAPVFPDDCEATPATSNLSDTGDLINAYTLVCAQDLRGRTLYVSGLEATLTDVIVFVQHPTGESLTLRATPDNTSVKLPEVQRTWQVVRNYFGLGVEHILLGPDHLLFVAGLVFLISGWRRLIETITAFTLAHSITLVGTSFNLFSLPPSPVQAVIALSIIFLAYEIANKQAGSERMSERRPWLVAASFGLLHGFGFAGALAELGLPENKITSALFAFNLGVEVGQFIFVAALLALLAVVKKIGFYAATEKLASYAIGITASVWLFERLV